MKKLMLMTSDLRKRGWTVALIRRFLGTPDRTAKNPVYRSKPPMRLYAPERVIAIEGTDEFKRELAKVPERRKHAQKSVATKRAKMQKFLDDLVVPLPTLSQEQLKKAAIKHYNARGFGLSASRTETWRPASEDSDPDFLDRICVNYLRHVCSRYESDLTRIAGKTGVDEG